MRGNKLKDEKKSIEKFEEIVLPLYNNRIQILDLTSTNCKFIDLKYCIIYERDRACLYKGNLPYYSKQLDWKEGFYNTNKDRFLTRNRPEEYLNVVRINNKTYIKYKDLYTGIIVQQRDESYFKGCVHKSVQNSLEEFVRTLEPTLKEGKTFLNKNGRYVEYIDTYGNYIKHRADSLLIGKTPVETLKNSFKDYFFQTVKALNKDKFDYSQTVYTSLKDTIIVFCNTCHKHFEQRAGNHLYKGYGCIHCWKESKTSQREREWREFFSFKGYNIETNIRPSWMNGLELDIFIPELNLAIEYNGLAFHSTYDSTGNLPKYVDKEYHLNKYLICKENNVNLLHIFEIDDQIEWENVLNKYLEHPEKYSINFENICNEVVYLSKDFTYFGRSSIQEVIDDQESKLKKGRRILPNMK